MALDSTSTALFLENGKFRPIGSLWRAPGLAAALRRIAERGRDGFYTGETADLIVASMKSGGGIISKADLASYQPAWRTPVEFGYRGHRVCHAPVSSGGLTRPSSSASSGKDRVMDGAHRSTSWPRLSGVPSPGATRSWVTPPS
jgi:gamma-glutamyltranspeptidase